MTFDGEKKDLKSLLKKLLIQFKPQKDDAQSTLRFSLLLLLFCIFFAHILVSIRPSVEYKKKVKQRKVIVEELSKGPQTLSIEVFGEVFPEKEITLFSPIRGKIIGGMKLSKGQRIPMDKSIFVVEKTDIDHRLSLLHLFNEQLEIDENKYLEEAQSLLAEKKSKQELQQIQKDSLIKHEKNLSITKELFEKAHKLHQSGNLSNSEFLKKQETLHMAQLKVLDAKKALETLLDALRKVDLSLVNNQSSIYRLQKEKERNHIKIEQEKYLREKCDIRIPFIGKVSEHFVELGQEVNPNTPLAKIHSLEKVKMHVHIPDSSFQWLYQGKLLDAIKTKNPHYQNMSIQLVNQNFSKVFKGAYLQSIASTISPKTRSLPLVIARDNPLDKEGNPISEDELKPGMYCKLTIPLCELLDVFLIPRQALQEGSKLYYVERLKNTNNLGLLKVIENIEVIQESSRGMITRLPKKYHSLQVVSHLLDNAQEGDRVLIEKYFNRKQSSQSTRIHL